VLNIKYMVLDHALLYSYPTTDSNTSTGMIRVTLNMPSAANRQGTSHCLESGHCVVKVNYEWYGVGGFLEFQATHPSLCQSQSACSTSTAAGYKCPPLTSMSQPCLPVSNVGPTKILPFLFLGSQQDALSQETMQVGGHILMTIVILILQDSEGIIVPHRII